MPKVRNDTTRPTDRTTRSKTSALRNTGSSIPSRTTYVDYFASTIESDENSNDPDDPGTVSSADANNLLDKITDSVKDLVSFNELFTSNDTQSSFPGFPDSNNDTVVPTTIELGLHSAVVHAANDDNDNDNENDSDPYKDATNTAIQMALNVRFNFDLNDFNN